MADELLLATLLSMGFDHQKSIDALVQTKNSSLEAAIEVLSTSLDDHVGASSDVVQSNANTNGGDAFGGVGVVDPRGQETRMIILVRTDLKMGTGKMCAQVAHAAVALTLSLQKKNSALLARWNNCNSPKVCLKVDSLQQLLNLEDEARLRGIPTASICDAGRTQIDPGTMTCVALCATKQELDRVTGKLKLL